MKFKITKTEQVVLHGKVVSDVTYYRIANCMTDYWTLLMEGEKLRDGHKDTDEGEYHITESEFKGGGTVVVDYYHAPSGLTILRGLSYERVDDDTPINDGPIYE